MPNRFRRGFRDSMGGRQGFGRQRRMDRQMQQPGMGGQQPSFLGSIAPPDDRFLQDRFNSGPTDRMAFQNPMENIRLGNDMGGGQLYPGQGDFGQNPLMDYPEPTMGLSPETDDPYNRLIGGGNVPGNRNRFRSGGQRRGIMNTRGRPSPNYGSSPGMRTGAANYLQQNPQQSGYGDYSLMGMKNQFGV